MSLNIDNIYCSQWLVNDTLKNYCKNPQNKAYFINPHDILHVKDACRAIELICAKGDYNQI